MVLAACGEGKLEYDKVSKIMRRIFESLGDKEGEWLGAEGSARSGLGGSKNNLRFRGRGFRSRGGRNPLNRIGKVSQCVICKSEWHWARECPENFQNKRKEVYLSKGTNEGEKDVEEIYIGDVGTTSEENWEDIEAVLDSGCRSTVCVTSKNCEGLG